MPIQKKSSDFDLHYLNQFLPSGAIYHLLPFFQQHEIEFVINKNRKTILGNYIYDPIQKTHKITVNSTLNPYAFLITTLHEIAHFLTFEKYKNKVLPHGKEWKNIFKEILFPFVQEKIFPDEIENQLLLSIQNLKASSCGDLHLAKILKKYDDSSEQKNHFLIEQIKPNECFLYEGTREFKMLGKVKKRYKCEEIKTKKIYLFYALCEIQKIS